MMQLWTLHSNLLLAIQDNDLDRAEEILRMDNVDPDVRFHTGYPSRVPAICLCVERGLYEMAKLFIHYGSSVNQVDDVGYSPLHFAASHQFVDLVKLLIVNRANVNAVSTYGQTPLHLACQQSSLEIVSNLVEAGANVEKRDCDGRTPLAMACVCNQVSIVTYLVKVVKVSVNTLDNCGNSPLLHAINCGLSLNYDLISSLLDAGADVNHVNQTGTSPLFTAIRRSSEHSLDSILTVQGLIHSGVNLNDPEPGLGESPLHLSILRGQDSITEALIRAGADIDAINASGHSALHCLAQQEKTELVLLLLAAGAKVHLKKSFWLDESGIAVRQFKNFKLRQLLGLDSPLQTDGLHFALPVKVPSLKHLSRVAIRKWLERKADLVIKQLTLPQTLKQYLLLLEL